MKARTKKWKQVFRQSKAEKIFCLWKCTLRNAKTSSADGKWY